MLLRQRSTSVPTPTGCVSWRRCWAEICCREEYRGRRGRAAGKPASIERVSEQLPDTRQLQEGTRSPSPRRSATPTGRLPPRRCSPAAARTLSPWRRRIRIQPLQPPSRTRRHRDQAGWRRGTGRYVAAAEPRPPRPPRLPLLPARSATGAGVATRAATVAPRWPAASSLIVAVLQAIPKQAPVRASIRNRDRMPIRFSNPSSTTRFRTQWPVPSPLYWTPLRRCRPCPGCRLPTWRNWWLKSTLCWPRRRS